MPRYREGASPQQLVPVDAGMTAVTAVIGLAIGVLMLRWGLRSGIWWLRIWGAGLILASVAYLLSTLIYL